MEKVVLTKEQAEAIENRSNIESALHYHATSRWTDKRNECLNRLSLEKFARALLVGYEIEKPKFKPGDKVIRLDGLCFAGFKNIEIVERVKENSITLSNDLQYSHDFMRHATPEEIYWLEELGRKEIGDFQEGDKYVDRAGLTMTATCRNDIADFKKYYEKGDFKGIYPVESFKSFNKEEFK